MPPKPLTNILVKPAGPDCNMACGYCFYADKQDLFGPSSRHRMTESVLEEMIRQLMEQAGEQVSLTWQGGEPTLMGLDFFHRAIDFQQRYGSRQVVGNGFQTNGMLIDDDWADFFSQYNVLVGLSIDGPKHVHDHYRKRGDGRGTWDRVLKSARLMLDKGVSVNALTVVNDYSVRFPREIYDFHKDAGLAYMQFIPCVENAPGQPERMARFSVPSEQYGEFLCTLFDLWIADFKDGLPTTSIRFFESLIFVYAGLTPPDCTLCDHCGTYVVVEHNGDVFSCDFFVEPRWRLGNVMSGRLDTMLNGRRQTDFGKIKGARPKACRDCPWEPVCKGGCPKDRRPTPHAGRMNYLCPGMKRFFAHADPHFHRLAQKALERQGLTKDTHGPVSTPPDVGRNAPCPCGSGKKFKRCCG
ncbi:MAG: anaerobic sulfatase maturase [Desulfobacterales bacterium]|nr:anaerobic sulfatase maturase [Desulfobacterales bacterium]